MVPPQAPALPPLPSVSLTQSESQGAAGDSFLTAARLALSPGRAGSVCVARPHSVFAFCVADGGWGGREKEGRL